MGEGRVSLIRVLVLDSGSSDSGLELWDISGVQASKIPFLLALRAADEQFPGWFYGLDGVLLKTLGGFSRFLLFLAGSGSES